MHAVRVYFDANSLARRETRDILYLIGSFLCLAGSRRHFVPLQRVAPTMANRRTSVFGFVLVALGYLVACPYANAAVQFDIAGPDFSLPAGGEPITPPHKLSLGFEQQAAADTVRLTIDPSTLPTDFEKITDVWFNSSVGGLAFQYVSGVAAISTGPGGNVASAGVFDWNFRYSPATSTGSFHVGSGTSVYDITAPGLTEASFMKMSSSPGPTGALYAAAHINKGGNGDSAHYGTNTVNPEPTACAMWTMLGLFFASVYRRRRIA
jgi:hypothetical protein